MNLALNVMVVIMFTIVHWYKDEAVESRKHVLYVLIAIYVGFAVRELIWAYGALGGYRGIYGGLRAVYNLIISHVA